MCMPAYVVVKWVCLFVESLNVYNPSICKNQGGCLEGTF